MRVINIVETEDNTVLGIDSFGIFEDQISDDVVKQAEELFLSRIRENGFISEDIEEIDDILDNGYWYNGIGYTANIIWSEI